MKIGSKTVYISEDGKEFFTKAECLEHEKNLVAKQRAFESLSVYCVAHGFDTTEGRGYSNITYFITDKSLSVVIQQCIFLMGKPLRKWYGGDDYYEAWKISKATVSVEEVMKIVASQSKSDGVTKCISSVLSDKDFTDFGLPGSLNPRSIATN